MTFTQLKSLQFITLLSCLSLLSGCSFLSPIKTGEQNKYVLSQLPYPIAKKNSAHHTLLVLPPDTRPIFNTTQIAYTIRPYQVAYFAKNDWAETPGQMLQPLIVQTLMNTHHYRAVVTPAYIGRYDYSLATQIIELEEDFTSLPAVVRLTVRAQLSSALNNRIIAIKQFSITEPLQTKAPYAGIVAANRATGKMLDELQVFCLRNTR